MPPKPFGGGGDTLLHPAALAALSVAALLMWFLPRRFVPVPLLFAGLLIPLDQQVVVAGLHFMVLRLLLLGGWIRILADIHGGRSLLADGLCIVDKLFLLWILTEAAAYTLLWQTTGALVVKLGLMYNAFGLYFFFRHFVRGQEDVERLVRALAVACVLAGALMTTEQLTGRNLMSNFGLPEFAQVRGGRIRSQASFATPITAGAFGAVLLPLFLGLAWALRRHRRYAIAGAAGATAMAMTSASSTPVFTYFAALAALIFWPLRHYTRQLRWAAAGLLVGLQLVMKAPVWALINRVDLTGSSTSWHRFVLVDSFLRRFGEWWLVGTRDNAKWGVDTWDAVNWYVAAGISGGLIGLALFVAILVFSFKRIGAALQRLAGDPPRKRFVWTVGASLFACVVSFWGIVLFDQSVIAWYAILAILIAATPAQPAAPAAAGGAKS